MFNKITLIISKFWESFFCCSIAQFTINQKGYIIFYNSVYKNFADQNFCEKDHWYAKSLYTSSGYCNQIVFNKIDQHTYNFYLIAIL